jgi:hypothetical protein
MVKSRVCNEAERVVACLLSAVWYVAVTPVAVSLFHSDNSDDSGNDTAYTSQPTSVFGVCLGGNFAILKFLSASHHHSTQLLTFLYFSLRFVFLALL